MTLGKKRLSTTALRGPRGDDRHRRAGRRVRARARRRPRQLPQVRLPAPEPEHYRLFVECMSH